MIVQNFYGNQQKNENVKNDSNSQFCESNFENPND